MLLPFAALIVAPFSVFLLCTRLLLLSLLLPRPPEPPLPLVFGQHPRGFHPDVEALVKAAPLTVLPRLKQNFARARLLARVLFQGAVLNGAAEEGAAAKASDRAVVNMLGSRLLADFALLSGRD